jgi:formamidopyrimidine-DNA glycosylase
MPELPEVETVARQLAPLVEGRAVRGLRVRDPLIDLGREPALAGLHVRRVFRLGKQVVLEMAREPAPGAGDGGVHRAFLTVHLRMTGRLVWRPARPAGAAGCERLLHLRAKLELEGGEVLFVDPRRFGTMRWLRALEEARPAGVDPLAPELTRRRLGELLAGSGQELKAWLLRQDRLVGLGNIYASEILFEAGLSPFRTAGSLRLEEVVRLHRALRGVLRRAIRHCGTTFSDFQGANGLTGSYQRYLKVYGREGAPCPSCGRTVMRAVQQQRSTFFCPHDQPPGRARRQTPASGKAKPKRGPKTKRPGSRPGRS